LKSRSDQNHDRRIGRFHIHRARPDVSEKHFWSITAQRPPPTARAVRDMRHGIAAGGAHLSELSQQATAARLGRSARAHVEWLGSVRSKESLVKTPEQVSMMRQHLLVILMTSALTVVSASANAGCEPNPGCPADPTGRFCGPTLEEMQREARAKQYPGASIGMTADQVKKETAWGEPCSVNRTVTANGEREQWVYPDYQYLYFVNGRLVSIETKGSH
jgi:hypothetical protein